MFGGLAIPREEAVAMSSAARVVGMLGEADVAMRAAVGRVLDECVDVTGLATAVVV
jgi:hypothetical protein